MQNSKELFIEYAQITFVHISTLLLLLIRYIGCPTRYRTRHFFNNFNTNEDIATKFEQGYVRCTRNEEERVCSVCL
jgi:predicted PhzF superfamily epimerase YddE/YHI9